MTALAKLWAAFRQHEGGNVALLFGMILLPIILAVGAAIDYGRVLQARDAAQIAADAGALAAATTYSDDVPKMRKIAENFVRSNFDETAYGKIELSTFDYVQKDKDITIKLSGAVDTAFMRMAGFAKLPYAVSASSTRAIPGTMEIALVLDNTWSMSGTKIVALKQAASNLVTTLKKDPKNTVKIALVPYADYVNVGTSNRSRSWVKVPDDYKKVNKGTCWTVKEKCVRGNAKTCTRTVDGVVESYDCTPSVCTPITPYQQCSSDSTQNFRWFGCVGTRTAGSLRLSDDSPSSPYPGFLSTGQNCLNPIVPLTDSEATIQKAIAGMVVNIGGYKPSTYIPAGRIWGLNVLSSSEPFSEAKAYDPANQDPKKALVLMTDGANTLNYRNSDGAHVAASGKSLDQSYSDMAAICENIKKKNIIVYTVSFDIDDERSKTTMRECATKPDFNFDAKDAQALKDAFDRIATSLSSLRLTR